MVLNKYNNSFPVNTNSLKERKEILNGYVSPKYLNKQYTSKSKRHLKTRDKSSKRKPAKNFKGTTLALNIENSSSEDDTSQEEDYCKTPELTFSTILDHKLNELKNEWVII
jgi:hypothetical protein